MYAWATEIKISLLWRPIYLACLPCQTQVSQLSHSYSQLQYIWQLALYLEPLHTSNASCTRDAEKSISQSWTNAKVHVNPLICNIAARCECLCWPSASVKGLLRRLIIWLRMSQKARAADAESSRPTSRRYEYNRIFSHLRSCRNRDKVLSSTEAGFNFSISHQLRVLAFFDSH